MWFEYWREALLMLLLVALVGGAFVFSANEIPWRDIVRMVYQSLPGGDYE